LPFFRKSTLDGEKCIWGMITDEHQRTKRKTE
jgi:hypothetical protein